jgi:3-oxoacyl-[acyl-carrier protein] reductase
LAREYGVVVGYGKNRDGAERLARELVSGGGEACVFGADVSDSGQAGALVDFAASRYGRLDLLVNCAGVSLRALASDTTDEQWGRVMAVNATGVFNTCRAALPYMISRGSGAIVNVSSIWGLAGGAFETAYSASKAAVIGFTKALAREVAPSGVTANCVAPGYVDTGMNGDLTEQERRDYIAGLPLGRAGKPEDIAKAIEYLAGDSFITGQVISPNGGAVI